MVVYWGVSCTPHSTTLEILYKILPSVMRADSLSCWHWWSKQLCCQLLYGRDLHCQLPSRNWGQLWQRYSNKKLPVDLNSADNRVSLGMSLSPAEPQGATTALAHGLTAAFVRSWSRGSGYIYIRAYSEAAPRLLTHSNCEIVNTCCFKPLSLWSFLMRWQITNMMA